MLLIEIVMGQKEKRKKVVNTKVVNTKVVNTKVVNTKVPINEIEAKMCKDSVIQKKNQHCKIQIQPFFKSKKL